MLLLAAAVACVLSVWVVGLPNAPASWSVVAEFFAAALRPAWVGQSTGIWLLPSVLAALWQTLVFATAATSLALAMGVPLALLSSTRFSPGAVAGCTRVVVTLMRSVHELLWAMVFLAALGLSNATAVLAIAIPFAGTFAKVFSELLDEAPDQARWALQDAGSPPLAALAIGLVPQALPDLAAYTLYRFECALRSAAVLGFFGLPTVGYYLMTSADNLHYQEVWTYLYALLALIIVIDAWSAAVRRRLVGP